ncbi:galactose mutarotase isoform X1 [Pectinophora gossypiella]|uniref:galactose mutarotase isoform X1 n=1 Tax=Pectinophora gossypiella TaxID=13191 RepID=UPI00214E8A65|nr:galactose mutarotase isoform X1 [Pectinophora gossypiella]
MVVLTAEDFGTFKGEVVKKYTWKTNSGFCLSAISYGAIIQSIKVKDKNGEITDIVLGFDDLDGYVTRNTPYFGAAIGRCANRIGGATFDIDGATYNVAKNIGNNHLHGGIVGFDKVNWKSTVDGAKVTFSYFSKDLEEGYPGNLVVSVSYEVTDDDRLHMDFAGTTDKRTVVNLTNHSYFNLAGHDTGSEELYNHVFVINADKITETDSDSIPTGNFSKVGGTPYDLRVAKRLGDVMDQLPGLYDDNFCVTSYENKGLTFVSHVVHPSSGRFLEVYSNQPGVQFYTSNGLPAPDQEAIIGKGGVGYRRHGAFCLETQNYPDAIHHQNFPKVVLSPGEVYDHKVVYSFGVDKRSSPQVVQS